MREMIDAILLCYDVLRKIAHAHRPRIAGSNEKPSASRSRSPSLSLLARRSIAGITFWTITLTLPPVILL